jgi:hypothetical protein
MNMCSTKKIQNQKCITCYFNIYRQEDWYGASEELKYNQSEEVHEEGENDMQGVEGTEGGEDKESEEHKEGEELKEDVEEKVPVKSKYDCYLPNEEQKEDLRERFGLDPKTSILSEIVPNKYTQSIGNIFLF